MSGNSSEPGKFASLSSGLLARKGDARPAMRRPTANLSQTSAAAGDDLGWNDFGEDDAREVTVSVHPKVKRQQQVIAEKLGAAPDHAVDDVEEDPTDDMSTLDERHIEAVIRPVVRDLKIKARRRGRARSHASAAFTLRLDRDRHLRLRLACAMHDVSAQKLLTEALDALFDSMPELEPLAERVVSR